MGATNPANAAEGTIRKKMFATSIERNCVHGSDAPETAAQEDSVLLRGERSCYKRALAKPSTSRTSFDASGRCQNRICASRRRLLRSDR